MNNQVDVVRHEHPSPDVEIEARQGLLDRLHEPLTDAISREEGKSAIAGERQFVSMARLIHVFAMMP